MSINTSDPVSTPHELPGASAAVATSGEGSVSSSGLPADLGATPAVTASSTELQSSVIIAQAVI